MNAMTAPCSAAYARGLSEPVEMAMWWIDPSTTGPASFDDNGRSWSGVIDVPTGVPGGTRFAKTRVALTSGSPGAEIVTVTERLARIGSFDVSPLNRSLPGFTGNAWPTFASWFTVSTGT